MAMLRIHEVAKEKGFNQARLQIESRLNPGTVNKYWNNKIRAVSLDVLEALAGALDCQVTDLISNEPDVQGADIRADLEALRSHAPGLADALQRRMDAQDGIIEEDDRRAVSEVMKGQGKGATSQEQTP